MIIQAKHHFFIYPFFQRYSLRKVNKNFHKVEILGDFEDKNLPLLLISNHVSWWDGFWIMYLNLKKLHRRFHFMMLEEQLRKHWYFNHAGGFSVNKSSRSIMESLRYTTELLSDNRNMVLIFPQGKIQTMHQQRFSFQKGIEKIVAPVSSKVQILFLANMVDYFSRPRPSLYMYIREYYEENISIKGFQDTYNQFYQNCTEQQLKREV